MCLESAQLLCNTHPTGAPYKHTHINHPCSIWVKESIANYNWLVSHGLEICYEYTRRYKKIHKTQSIIEWCKSNEPKLSDVGLTPFVICVKDKIDGEDPISAYRNYYIAEKVRFAKWEPLARIPFWWPN
jgi:hypothetical protein